MNSMLAADLVAGSAFSLPDEELGSQSRLYIRAMRGRQAPFLRYSLTTDEH